MSLLWNSLATRKVRLLAQALTNRHNIHPETSWANYVRCHDDIGWTFSDEDAAMLGVNGSDHRRFLNDFYRGRFESSFARGLPFQENPKTGDCRISGTCASLAGLEKAIHENDPAQIEYAIRRILLIHGVILTAGGVPLLYLGDEIGMLNDYSYESDHDHARDSRWVHRPRADWKRYENRHNPETIEGKVYLGLQALIALRKGHEAFAGGDLDIFHTENNHVVGFIRNHNDRQAFVFCNFSEDQQVIPAHILAHYNLSALQLFSRAGSHMDASGLVIKPLDLVAFS